MNTFAIVKLEVAPDIVSEFNGYMQQKEHAMAFVSGNEGYFRIHYGDVGASSAAITVFGSFLEHSGYSISAIGSGTTKEGEEGTQVCFEKDGKISCAVLSTLNIY